MSNERSNNNKRSQPGSSGSTSGSRDSTPSKIPRNITTDSQESYSSFAFITPPSGSQNKAFWNAVIDNDLSMVKEMLDKGYDVNQQNAEGETALIIAAGDRHLEMLELLLSRGANPNVEKKTGVTALHIAASEGYLDIVSALIASPICDKEIRDSYNQEKTALLWASQENHIEIVQVLLKAGAKTDVVNKDGDTALTLALTRRHHDIVKILIEHDIADAEEREFLLAVVEGRAEEVRNILAGGGNSEITFQGWTPLLLAALVGKTEVVRVLLEAGCNINACDPLGRDALWWATIRGSLFLKQQITPGHCVYNHFIAEEDWPQTICELVANQCSLNAERYSEPQCQYLLSVALKKNMIELVRELMYFDFDRDFKMDQRGETPLLYAIAQKSTEIVDILLGAASSSDATRRMVSSQWGMDQTYNRLCDQRQDFFSSELHIHLDPIISQLFQRGCYFEATEKWQPWLYKFFISRRVKDGNQLLPIGYDEEGCYIPALRKGDLKAFEKLLEYSEEALKVWFFTMPRFLQQSVEPEFRQYQAAKKLEASQPSSSSSGSLPSVAPSLAYTFLSPPSSPTSAARTSTDHGFPSCRSRKR